MLVTSPLAQREIVLTSYPDDICGYLACQKGLERFRGFLNGRTQGLPIHLIEERHIWILACAIDC